MFSVRGQIVNIVDFVDHEYLSQLLNFAILA